MIRIFVPRVDEFMSMVDSVSGRDDVSTRPFGDDYVLIETLGPITFNRRALKMKPAVWYGLFTGGLSGKIAYFGRDEVTVVPTNYPD